METKTFDDFKIIMSLSKVYVSDSSCDIPGWVFGRDSESFTLKYDPERFRYTKLPDEYAFALKVVREGFELLATAPKRYMERILLQERCDERSTVMEEEVYPANEAREELREALEAMLSASSGVGMDEAKKMAYKALSREH